MWRGEDLRGERTYIERGHTQRGRHKLKHTQKRANKYRKETYTERRLTRGDLHGEET